MSDILLKIKSKYNLKQIFTYLDYFYALKMIKNNKNLQRNLGINLQQYKKAANFQCIVRTTKIKIIYNSNYDRFEAAIKHSIYLILAIVLFIYVLIFSSILTSKGAFNENNTKENYNKNYSKLIDKINLSLFGFLAYIIISYILIFFGATDKCYIDYGIIIIFKKSLLIILALLYLLYDILIIIKLYLSYKIKKNKNTWFMVCDYILIIFIFIYL